MPPGAHQALVTDSTKTGQMCHYAKMPVSTHARPISISLIAVPEVSAAVVYGLHEVFSCVGTAWESLTGEQTNTRQVIPRIVGSSTAPMRTTFNATLVPDHTFDEEHRSDVVIVGDLNFADDSGPLGRWEHEIEWIRDQYEKGAIICSVCTGSMMLAEAGLLNAREATTHWSARGVFEECYPQVLLKPERVLVPSGLEHRIVTSGGATSWTELALYLVARFCGMQKRGGSQRSFCSVTEAMGNYRLRRWLVQNSMKTRLSLKARYGLQIITPLQIRYREWPIYPDWLRVRLNGDSLKPQDTHLWIMCSRCVLKKQSICLKRPMRRLTILRYALDMTSPTRFVASSKRPPALRRTNIVFGSKA